MRFDSTSGVRIICGWRWLEDPVRLAGAVHFHGWHIRFYHGVFPSVCGR